MYINKSNVLGDIADLQKSPWFKSGADSENFCLRNQYIGRKEAVEIVRDLCIVKAEPVQAIPISENATNGDVVMTMFPGYHVQISTALESVNLYYEGTEEYTGSCIRFDLNWWNTPYKGVN